VLGRQPAEVQDRVDVRAGRGHRVEVGDRGTHQLGAVAGVGQVGDVEQA
jgi:hypothetical protein